MGDLVKVASLGLVDGEDVFGDGGAAAANASREAAGLTAAGQREALDYLKEREAIPRQFSEGALTGLAGVYGLEGGTGSQQELIDRAMQSPLYQSIMGGQEVGEQAILRNASATGGLRSGDSAGALTDYGSQLSNQALLTAYQDQLTGLQGMANLPTNTNAIANATAAPNQTLAQGNLAAAQAQQQAQQGMTNNMFGLAGAGLMAFSDIRLKDNVQYIGEDKGHSIFRWDWNDEAKKLGLTGEGMGVMAHLVHEYMPYVVSEKDGYMMIDYSRLNIEEAA